MQRRSTYNEGVFTPNILGGWPFWKFGDHFWDDFFMKLQITQHENHTNLLSIVNQCVVFLVYPLIKRNELSTPLTRLSVSLAIGTYNYRLHATMVTFQSIRLWKSVFSKKPICIFSKSKLVQIGDHSESEERWIPTFVRILKLFLAIFSSPKMIFFSISWNKSELFCPFLSSLTDHSESKERWIPTFVVW